MTAEKILELLFVFGAVKNEPPGCRISDAVAEDKIKPPANLIDEVIHIGFQAAVIIARKKQPSPVIQEHPTGKMNGRDSRELAACINMARGPVQNPQQEDKCPTAK